MVAPENLRMVSEAVREETIQKGPLVNLLGSLLPRYLRSNLDEAVTAALQRGGTMIQMGRELLRCSVDVEDLLAGGQDVLGLIEDLPLLGIGARICQRFLERFRRFEALQNFPIVAQTLL